MECHKNLNCRWNVVIKVRSAIHHFRVVDTVGPSLFRLETIGQFSFVSSDDVTRGAFDFSKVVIKAKAKVLATRNYANDCASWYFGLTQQLRWPSGMSVRFRSCRLGFDSESGQTNDFKIGIHSFPT